MTNMLKNLNVRKMRIAMLSSLATLMLSLSLPAGCVRFGRKLPASRPALLSFQYFDPGTTNTIVVPVDCEYGVFTTDKGLLHLQGF